MRMVSARLMVEDTQLFKDVAKQKQLTALCLDRSLAQVPSLTVNEKLHDKANQGLKFQIQVMYFPTH